MHLSAPTRWLLRHGVVLWLLVVEPVSLALTLDRALPRMPLSEHPSTLSMPCNSGP